MAKNRKSTHDNYVHDEQTRNSVPPAPARLQRLRKALCTVTDSEKSPQTRDRADRGSSQLTPHGIRPRSNRTKPEPPLSPVPRKEASRNIPLSPLPAVATARTAPISNLSPHDAPGHSPQCRCERMRSDRRLVGIAMPRWRSWHAVSRERRKGGRVRACSATST